ncbi:MAG: transporter substrate-binding domain-containing protein [Candidatus Obscuribacterales bacterium]|nr:transporter substrate-binding domain-containing protein [Candidatus Obscuribacterales bacterium]
MISSFTRFPHKQMLLTLLSCVAITLSGCSNTAIKQTSTEGSVYDRVIKQGSIRCGYVIYNPGCLKDPNTGKLSGIGVETLELAAKNLGLKVEWTEEVGWGSMIEGLQTNRYDMVVTPVWTNANRARQIDFSKPLFFSPIFAYAKTGNKDISGKDIKAFNSPASTIATVDGETAEIIVREDFPQAKVVSLPQLSDISQMLLTVSSGKADITFVEPAVAAAFLKTNPGAIEPLKSSTPVRVFPNSWMFRRGQLEFKDMIDTALEQLINSGAVNKIISKYEPAPNTLYRVALPYQKPNN